VEERETNTGGTELRVRRGTGALIRKATNKDRQAWLSESLRGGKWGALKTLRRVKQIKQANIQNLQGERAGTADRPGKCV
jgi:hypothetical protein